ncbi:MAG: dihydrolipoyl dehydrogenase [Candidatus Symbiothrix sp.]|jgi:dihydrolipoamide dehydrogenase|nr:dihydrolipoyl dehydrogenase [Candidatus Symbiothrix sp.]
MLYDIAIIGGGPAGYTAAELAGRRGLSVVLFEKNALGGVCLNEGCIPTKTLLYSAKTYQSAKDAAKYGISCNEVAFDFAKMMARKNKVVRKLVAGIRSKMTAANVEVVIGEATCDTTAAMPQISCNGNDYQAKKLMLCIGSETAVPPIAGLDATDYWTSREALQANELPESLTIIGGGVIGIEFAAFFNTLGCRVTVVEMLDEILGGMDKELSALLRTELSKRGIVFHLSTKVTAVKDRQITIEKDGETQLIESSRILLSVGRRPIVKGLKVNEFMQTENPNVYACGDITGYSMLAHTAVREAEIAVGHILGASEKMSYRAIPAVVYTSPEIAGVGKTEETLQKEGIAYIVKQLPMSYSGRFVAENELANGVCKILESTDGKILGVHLLGNPASELVVIAAMAIEKEWSSEDLKSIVFPHPTVGEIIKETL